MVVDIASKFSIFSGLICFASVGAAQEPLSAIDWLSRSVVSTAAAPVPRDTTVIGAVTDGPLANNALPETVTVTSLDKPSLDGVGLLTPAKTGLPRALWGFGKTDDILSLILRQKTKALPALQGLLLTVLLAEAEPPLDAGPDSKLLIGRVDKMLEMGALDQAMALLVATGDLQAPDLFRRMFDISLLTGAEDRACRKMTQSPGLSPALSARIFCLARNGDWETAAVTLQTAEGLGQISSEEAALLTRFLDPAIAEETGAIDPPSPLTPLDLRIFEAIGEPVPIANLPLAFAHSDLSVTTGWKSRLEAAERLSRAGAIAPNLLLGFYTQQKPAASGGIWDRVKAFQTLETALGKRDPESVAAALPPAIAAMAQVELEVVFAELFADRLAPFVLTGKSADAVTKLQLLSSNYAKLTIAKTSQDPVLLFSLGIAQANIPAAPTPNGMARAISAAWRGPEMPQDIAAMIEEKRIGEAILNAIERINSGVNGQLSDVTVGLGILRELGMEDVSRRTALELMLLERSG
jgi:hypothetical protein